MRRAANSSVPAISASTALRCAAGRCPAATRDSCRQQPLDLAALIGGQQVAVTCERGDRGFEQPLRLDPLLAQGARVHVLVRRAERLLQHACDVVVGSGRTTA